MAPNLTNRDRVQFKQYNPFDDIDFLSTVWLALQKKCRHSYFNSWGWISTWIKSLPPGTDIKLVVGYVDDEPVIGFFIGRNRRRKYGFLPSNVVSLNSTSISRYDQLFIEYNSMLAAPSVSGDVDFLFDYLFSLKWDEFSFPGWAPGGVDGVDLERVKDIAARHDSFLLVENCEDSNFVELDKIRAAGMDYLKLLSSNRRSQIRRSIKQYEQDGKIQVKEAGNVTEAIGMFENLVLLHQKEWEKRGKPGAFSNQYLLQFHRDLIRTRFDEKEIQVLHIYNDKMDLGYLYNFIYNGEVLFYQSGFNYLAENLYRPGLVSHYFAVMHNAAKDMLRYDFLAGDTGYKSSLSTASVQMYWMRLVRGRVRFQIEKGLADLKEKLRSTPKLKTQIKNIVNRFVPPARAGSDPDK